VLASPSTPRCAAIEHDARFECCISARRLRATRRLCLGKALLLNLHEQLVQGSLEQNGEVGSSRAVVFERAA
jgi:hypothetical protein